MNTIMERYKGSVIPQNSTINSCDKAREKKERTLDKLMLKETSFISTKQKKFSFNLLEILGVVKILYFT